MTRHDTQLFGELFALEDRVALVTGARQGIGRVLAVGLARAGARVVVTSRDRGGLTDLASELDEFGAEHLELELDVGNPGSVGEAVSHASEHWGRLDIVINNAGVALRKPALEITADEWDEVLDVNLRGVFLICQEAARRMPGGGSIVNLSSTFAKVAVADRVAYAAAKAGLEQMTRVLALEWASRGITVNTLAPTTIVTESRRAAFADESVREARIREIPLGRLGEPEDLVGAALLLVGRAGTFITGTTLAVDGGYTLGQGRAVQ
jgi:2-dehydro-3-deoxy-D-gluconate 5-dehydrogenase